MTINEITEYLYWIYNNVLLHEAWLLFYGICLGAVTDWSHERNKDKALKFKQWRHDYKDDFYKDLMWGFAFVIFDDEALELFNAVLTKTGFPPFQEIDGWFYFVMGISIDRIVSFLRKKP